MRSDEATPEHGHLIVAVGLAVGRRLRAHRPGLGQPLRARVIGLVRQPRLATLMTGSGTTTVLLAFAFAASTAMVPGPHSHASAGALLVGYMLGAAAGNAIPTPAVVGSTETALIAVLVAAAVPLAHAVEVVVVFRLITFWLPAAAGILSTRDLPERGPSEPLVLRAMHRVPDEQARWHDVQCRTMSLPADLREGGVEDPATPHVSAPEP